MDFSRRQIIQALCNEYNDLFKDAYEPGVDLTFEEYQSASGLRKPSSSLRHGKSIGRQTPASQLNLPSCLDHLINERRFRCVAALLNRPAFFSVVVRPVQGSLSSEKQPSDRTFLVLEPKQN